MTLSVISSMDGPTIPIDLQGDLTLIVGSGSEVCPVMMNSLWTPVQAYIVWQMLISFALRQAKSFRVSSSAMKLASPVWRAMLSVQNGFKESTHAEDVVFPDDDCHSIFVLLLACHLRFQDIPDKLEFAQLVALSVVCDKYDCISLIRPWLSTWMSPWKHRVAQPGFEAWAFIAWVVGDEDTFKRATDHIVLTCTNRLPASVEQELPPGVAGKNSPNADRQTRLLILSRRDRCHP